jgi:hypothetical protein
LETFHLKINDPKNSYKLAINASEIKGNIGFNTLACFLLAIKK